MLHVTLSSDQEIKSTYPSHGGRGKEEKKTKKHNPTHNLYRAHSGNSLLSISNQKV